MNNLFLMNRLIVEVKEALKEAEVSLSDITTTCLIGGWYGLIKN